MGLAWWIISLLNRMVWPAWFSCLPLQSGIVGFSLSFVAPKKLLNLWRRNKNKRDKLLRTLKELSKSNWMSRCAWDSCLTLNPNDLKIDNPKTLSVMLVTSLDWLSAYLVLRLRLSLVIVHNMTNSYSFVIYSLETGKWRTLGILVGWFQYEEWRFKKSLPWGFWWGDFNMYMQICLTLGSGY